MIELKNLSKTFTVGKGKTKTTTVALTDVSFEIADGKKVGLIGKSGEGKSTIANVLCGAVAPSGGNVFKHGKALWDDKGKYDKLSGEKIQLVPQQPLLALDPMQRAGNAVKEALVATKHAKRGNDVKQKALRLFDIVGLERTLWGRLPLHLSGGQAQRLVIARALATEPTLLISDESTSMLDPSTSQSILDLYDRLVDTLGISVLFISHDVAMVKNFCDEIYLLKDGSVTKE